MLPSPTTIGDLLPEIPVGASHGSSRPDGHAQRLARPHILMSGPQNPEDRKARASQVAADGEQKRSEGTAGGKGAVGQALGPQMGPPKSPGATPPPPNAPVVIAPLPPSDTRWNALHGLRHLLGWLLSSLVHLLILVIFALWFLEPTTDRPLLVITAAVNQEADEPAAFELSEPDPLLEAAAADAPAEQQTVTITEISPITLPFTQPVAAVAEPIGHEATRLLASQNLLQLSAAPTGGGLDGRTGHRRSELVASQGGTIASERAVEAGLAWLAVHQRQDGSWWLQHDETVCSCRHPGVKETSLGATGLALLPFLGAGYTHRQGPYQQVVARGLEYLESRLQSTPHGGSLQEGASFGMYTHGIATVAICEAYAMTQDPALRPLVEQTVSFIQNAQHPRGGWRYNPGEPGDTTVTGWQVMALKSARLAGYETSENVWTKAGQFLDSVQTPDGHFYGYQSRKKEPGPTAVALLVRMYQGWLRNEAKLERGVTYLATLGPSDTDMYYNYYATQVLHHYGGNSWSRWNRQMRDYLVETQAVDGHEQGSWYFSDRHGTIGGRLYTTAICLMILEVYYRHLPLYGDQAVDTW